MLMLAGIIFSRYFSFRVGVSPIVGAIKKIKVSVNVVYERHSSVSGNGHFVFCMLDSHSISSSRNGHPVVHLLEGHFRLHCFMFCTFQEP